MNIGEHRYLFKILFSFPLGTDAEVGLLDRTVVLFLNCFEELRNILHNIDSHQLHFYHLSHQN